MAAPWQTSKGAAQGWGVAPVTGRMMTQLCGSLLMTRLNHPYASDAFYLGGHAVPVTLKSPSLAPMECCGEGGAVGRHRVYICGQAFFVKASCRHLFPPTTTAFGGQ